MSGTEGANTGHVDSSNPSDSRFPPLQSSQMSKEQETAYELMSTTCESMFGDTFTWQENSALIGPFNPLLRTPTLVGPYFALIRALSSLSGLPPDARETTILATGSHYLAAYETYAHERVAAKTTSLTQAQIDSIKVGTKPEGLSEAADVAFDVAVALTGRSGPLEHGVWMRARRCLGQEGALACVHYVGIYAYTCVLLNAADVGVPGS